jgi:chitinase
MKNAFVFILILSNFIPAEAQSSKDTFGEKKVIGYVPSWSAVSTVDYANLTHAFFSFLKPAADGSLSPYSAKQETTLATFLVLTKKNNCKKFISLSDGGAETFPIMAANPEARKKFVRNVLLFCQKKGFEGIDIDWESMNNETRKKNYTLLLKEFRQALDTTKLELVATVYFGERCRWIENEALQQANWMNVMAYDQSGLRSDGPFGNHASFEHFLQAAQYWTGRGFKKENLVMGLPFYGYRFSSEAGGKGKAVRYKDIVTAFPGLTTADNQTPGKDWCFFNGPDLIYKKTKYALDNGFAGLMIWEMSQDSRNTKSLHKAILQAFRDYK